MKRVKFALLADLGTIVVTADYDHATLLASFREQNEKPFYCYDEAITDQHFAKPSRVLKPGDGLQVQAYKQVVASTSSEQRLAFLDSQHAVYTGAQGATLVWAQKSSQLPKDFWYASMDRKERLWKDAGGNYRVTGVSAYSDGDFSFGLGYFGCVWHGLNALLCLRDLA